MSGLFKRLSSRRSAGPEGSEPQQATGPGAADATPPAEPAGHQSLLTDPAAPTRVLREGEQPTGLTSGDPLAPAQPAAAPAPVEPSTPASYAAPAPSAPIDPSTPVSYAAPAPVDPNAPAPFGPQPAGAQPNPFAPAPYGPQPAAYVAPPVEPIADLPAGLDPDELGAAPGTSARRGKLRRRAAFLRAARELLLRDLGGFVYELHRTAHDIEHEAHRRLRETKLARLTRVDTELHEIEVRLDDVRRQVLVREPGVGGECPHCGELFGSAAHYCSHCGNPLTEAARRELAKAQPAVPAPAVVAGPAPIVAPEPAAAEPAPTASDQPTQEIAPLDDPNAAFQWPARPATDASTPVGEGEPATPVGEGDPETSPRDDAVAAGEATPVGEGEPATPREAETTMFEPATPVGEGDPATSPRDDAEAVSSEAPRDDVVAAADETPRDDTVAAADETPRDDTVAAADETPRDDAVAAADEAPREDTVAAGDETPGADAPHGDAAAGGDDATTTGGDGSAPATNGAGETGGEFQTWRGQAANGRDDSILSPVERRQ